MEESATAAEYQEPNSYAISITDDEKRGLP
jgi:hypothetical protein